MLSPRWKKVLRDLGGNKGRTALVVLSIAIGVFAVGTVTHTFTIVSQELAITYPKANPAAATISADPFDDDLVETVRHIPGVEDAEARSTTVGQIIFGEQEKKQFLIMGIPDFDRIRINKVTPQTVAYDAAPAVHAERGTWPPPDRTIVLERSDFLVAGFVPPTLQVNDALRVEIQGKEYSLRVAGLAHESTAFPAPFMGAAYGYVNMTTYEWLTGSNKSTSLYITVRENKLDQAHIRQVADLVKNKIEGSGRTVYSVSVPTPGKHPLADIFAGLLLLLNLLGFMSLFLSGFLVVNTISALLAQQTRQIGMMKAIGGRQGQIVALYLVIVLVYGVMALVVAIPTAAFTAGTLSRFLAGFVNVDFPDFTLPTSILATEMAIGLLLPLLTALIPILSGTRVTVREALSDYGLGKGQFKVGLLDRLLERARGMSRPMMLSFRNTFRRKGRLALTLMTLTVAGTIFMSVVSVHASMLLTLDDVLKYWQFDILLPLAHPYRADLVEEKAASVPGVVTVESWGYSFNARRLRPDETETDTVILFAPPPHTQMIFPTVIQGRWLLPEDENAIVVSTDVLNAEKDLKVGDEIILKIQGRKIPWRIVGTVHVVGFRGGLGTAYVNYPYYAKVVGLVGRAESVQIVTAQHDRQYQEQVQKQIEQTYKLAGIRVGEGGMTSALLREGNEVFFNIITALLMFMAVLMAAVGGLGLMGTMSLNVLERTREIGVMRAVGASNGAIRRIVLAEGIFIGLLSAVFAIFLSVPLSQGLAMLVGHAIFQLPLSFTISWNGIIMWFVIVTVLSSVASILPAFNASRLTVREILAYE